MSLPSRSEACRHLSNAPLDASVAGCKAESQTEHARLMELLGMGLVVR